MSHQTIARRDVLRAAAAAGAGVVLFGMPLPARAEVVRIKIRRAEPQPPKFTCSGADGVPPEALERMKNEAKPGVVFVAPVDPQQQEALAGALMTLLMTTDDPAVHRLMVQAVYVCVSEKAAADAFPDRKPGWNVLHLDHDGKLTDGAGLPTEEFVEKFVPTLHPLVYGEDGRRLRDRAAAQRERLGAELSAKLDAAIANLGHADGDKRDAASADLAELAPRATAVLLLALNDAADPEVGTRLAVVLDRLFVSAPAHEPGPRLPYGFSWANLPSDPCPGCGRGYVPPKSRDFLRMLNA